MIILIMLKVAKDHQSNYLRSRQ